MKCMIRLRIQTRLQPPQIRRSRVLHQEKRPPTRNPIRKRGGKKWCCCWGDAGEVVAEG